MVPAELRTARLLLRPPVAGDAEWIFESYAQDPEVTRYLSWAPHADVCATRGFLKQLLVSLSAGELAAWIIEVAGGPAGTIEAGGPAGTIEAGGPAGMIEARGVAGFKAELGYVLARPFWGQGIMSEAVAAVVPDLLGLPHIHRVSAMCDVDNPGSARVLEKAGLEREGLLRRYGIHPNVSLTIPRDVHVYSKVR